MAEPRRRRSSRDSSRDPGRPQARRIGTLSLLLPPLRPPASAVGQCLAGLAREWEREGNLAAL